MSSDSEPTFLDYARILWAARWLIVTITVFAAASGFAAARLLPKVYIARATVLPPKDSGGGGASMALSNMLSSVLGGGGREGGGFSLPGISLSAASVTTNQDVFIAVLGSRTMREEVLGHFAKTDPRVAEKVWAVKPLIDPREKGIISLSVEAASPTLASELANYYFEALDRMLERYADQSMRRQEAVFTMQLDRAAKEVETAEQSLLKFQADNRILAVGGGRSESGAATAAALRASIQSLELQREVNRMKFTDQHPVMREMDKQISELKRQYSKNLFGAAMELPPEEPGIKGLRREFFVSAERMTPVQFAFLKLVRNLQIQEGFYTGAIQGLQQIKYGEGASYGRVIVLDPAIPPGAPAKPNVMLVVGGATGAGLVVAMVLVFLMEYVRRARALERRRLAAGEWRGNGRAGIDADRVPAGASVPAVRPTVPS